MWKNEKKTRKTLKTLTRERKKESVKKAQKTRFLRFFSEKTWKMGQKWSFLDLFHDKKWQKKSSDLDDWLSFLSKKVQFLHFFQFFQKVIFWKHQKTLPFVKFRKKVSQKWDTFQRLGNGYGFVVFIRNKKWDWEMAVVQKITKFSDFWCRIIKGFLKIYFQKKPKKIGKKSWKFFSKKPGCTPNPWNFGGFFCNFCVQKWSFLAKKVHFRGTQNVHFFCKTSANVLCMPKH